MRIDRAVSWFDVDEALGKVRILAAFFGGQDHLRHMLFRLLGGRQADLTEAFDWDVGVSAPDRHVVAICQRLRHVSACRVHG